MHDRRELIETAFPARIFIYERVDTSFEDYEGRAPGYGYSMGYRIPKFTTRRMTAYIYDRLLRPFPASITDPTASDEFFEAEFSTFRNLEFYSDADITDEGFFALEGCPTFRYALARVVDADTSDSGASLLAMTVWSHHYFKVRITQPPSGDALEDMKLVIDRWAEHLWSVSPQASSHHDGLLTPVKK